MNNNLRVIKYSSSSKEAWDEFVGCASGCWFFHNSEWGELCDDVFGQTNLSFVVAEGKHIVAAMPLSLQSKALFRFLISPPFGGYGGLVIKDGLDHEKRCLVAKKALDHVRQLAKEYGADTYAFKGTLDSTDTAATLRKAWPEFRLEETGIRLIDLHRAPQELWRDVKDGARYSIKKAEKNGVTIISARSPGDVKEFYRLLEGTFRREGAKSIPEAYYTGIMERFSGSGMAEILFSEYKGNRVGAIFLLNYKDTSFYLAGCSDKQYQALGINHLIQWHAIKMLKDRGLRWYILGEVSEGGLKDKDQKIQFFESRLGGCIKTVMTGSICFRPWKHNMFESLKRLVRGILPNR